jgi:hypothetical protein
MTVHGQAHDHFSASASEIAEAIQEVLTKHPPYRNTIEIEAGAVFKTNVKPSWWLLGTNMTIQVQPSTENTQVVVSIKSQWFITGDVFNYYNRYINDFLDALRTKLQQ